MDTGRNRSTPVPSLGKALLGAAVLALIVGSATREHLEEETAARAEHDAQAWSLTAAVRAGQQLEQAAEFLAAAPVGVHSELRAELARAERQREWAACWSSLAELRRVAASYEAATIGSHTDASFVAQRSALRFALGRSDPEGAQWAARAPLAANRIPERWLADPEGRWTALEAWRLLRDGEGEQAYRHLARAPSALRIELALAGAAAATTPRGRQTWINRGLKHAMNSLVQLPPGLVWRFNRARAELSGGAVGPAPAAHDALGELLAAGDLLASDPEAAAERAARVRGLPPGGLPLAPLTTSRGTLLVSQALAARVLEARAWAAAGDPELSAEALELARGWASCDPRPLSEWVHELR